MAKPLSNSGAWQTLGQREIHDASPFLRLTVEHVRLPDGREVRDYYRLDKPDYALVVPRLADGRYLLLRQYKHGVKAAGYYPPGGHVAVGETPLAAVQRELLEETGYGAERWRSLGSFTVDANQGCGRAHLFLAEELRRTAAPCSGDLEEIQLVELTLPELRAAVGAGEVNALGAVAAFALALNPDWTAS